MIYSGSKKYGNKESLTEFPVREIKTSPYYMQSNGVLERVHSSLEAMLAEAHSLGQNWMPQLPLALFAWRQYPNRSTGYSPYELVYGNHVRTPLDVLFEVWRRQTVNRLKAQD